MRDGDVGNVAARDQSERCIDVGWNILNRRGDPAHGSAWKQVDRFDHIALFGDDDLVCQKTNLGGGPVAHHQSHLSIRSGVHASSHHAVRLNLGGAENVKVVGAKD